MRGRTAKREPGGPWLFFAGFVFGKVGAVFVVVEVVVDGVVLAGVAAGELGGAAVVFLVLLALFFGLLLLRVHNGLAEIIVLNSAMVEMLSIERR